MRRRGLGVSLWQRRRGPLGLADDGEIAAVSGFRDDERVVVFYEGQAFEFGLASRGTGTSHGVHDGEIEAPMPGKVTAVEVSQGEKVAKGNACSRSKR